MKFKSGDWVKVDGNGMGKSKVWWVYGYIVVIRGERACVERGYLGQLWVDVARLMPATIEQTPREVEDIQNALRKIVERKGER